MAKGRDVFDLCSPKMSKDQESSDEWEPPVNTTNQKKMTFADLVDKDYALREHEARLKRLTLGAEEYLRECAKEIADLEEEPAEVATTAEHTLIKMPVVQTHRSKTPTIPGRTPIK